MTPASARLQLNAAILKRIRHDFPYFCETFLKIENDDGDLIAFVLKPQQLDLWLTELEPALRENRPIRVVILKARQLGFSTMVQAFMLWMALTRPGRGCLVMTHKEDASQNLFRKIEVMIDELPPAYAARLAQIEDRSQQGRMRSWKRPVRSAIKVDTAGNKNVGRGFTFQIVHASEVAFWEHYKRVFGSLMSALRKKPGTIMIVETTANGTGTPFHRLWKRAKSGKGLWRAKFYPWHEDPQWSLAIPEDEKVVWTKEERRLRRIFGLTDEQLYWRRVTIEDDYDGDVDLFRQEHPMTDEEAFIVSGSPYFPTAELERMLDRCRKPLKMGELKLVNGLPHLIEEHLSDDDLRKRVERGTEPSWWIWERPRPGGRYIVCADPAGGTSRDACAAHVIDLVNLRVVASFRNYEMDPDDFADQLRWMGISYKRGMVAPESNGEGRSTILRLSKVLRYFPLFYHVNPEEWSGGVVSRWGWRTTSKTRPVMLGDLFGLVAKRKIDIPCERTVREMMTFVRKPEKQGRIAEAADGTHDDMVMSLAIGASNEARTLALTAQFEEAA